MMSILQAPPDMHRLRSRLYQIAQEPDLPTQAERIEALRKEFAHSIQVFPTRRLHNSYNCVMHALGLKSNDFAAPEIAASQAKPRFIDFLICRDHFVSQPIGVNGLLVVYFKNNKAQHIGRMIDNSRVVSKWGTGHLCEHALWEVPCNYGDNASFFVPVDHHALVDSFCQWQKSEGRNL